MIARLLGAAARLVFGAALVAGVVTLGLVYLSYRLVRAATVGSRDYPVQEAAFGLLKAGALLALALKAQRPAGPPATPYVEED